VEKKSKRESKGRGRTDVIDGVGHVQLLLGRRGLTHELLLVVPGHDRRERPDGKLGYEGLPGLTGYARGRKSN
jgi:hypothetical protein